MIKLQDGSQRHQILITYSPITTPRPCPNLPWSCSRWQAKARLVEIVVREVIESAIQTDHQDYFGDVSDGTTLSSQVTCPPCLASASSTKVGTFQKHPPVVTSAHTVTPSSNVPDVYPNPRYGHQWECDSRENFDKNIPLCGFN